MPLDRKDRKPKVRPAGPVGPGAKVSQQHEGTHLKGTSRLGSWRQGWRPVYGPGGPVWPLWGLSPRGLVGVNDPPSCPAELLSFRDFKTWGSS